jgi:hypothetical protein
MNPAMRDEHAKMAGQVMNQMWRGDKTPEEKLELFRVMEERYPGVGWGMEGVSLQKWYKRRGLIQDDPCPY